MMWIAIRGRIKQRPIIKREKTRLKLNREMRDHITVIEEHGKESIIQTAAQRENDPRRTTRVTDIDTGKNRRDERENTSVPSLRDERGKKLNAVRMRLRRNKRYLLVSPFMYFIFQDICFLLVTCHCYDYSNRISINTARTT